MKAPQPRHIRSEDGRVTYLSQGDLGPLRGSRLLPELADFNVSFPGLDGNLGHLSAIQEHRFQAPEVLRGCPWSYSVDIWNLGLLINKISPAYISFYEILNNNASINRCGIFWKISACSTGLLVRTANTMHISTLHRWFLSWESRQRNWSLGSEFIAHTSSRGRSRIHAARSVRLWTSFGGVPFSTTMSSHITKH